ncbi:alpha-L-arabinofuranosidase [Methylobacterium nodulans]|uniref:Alpha-L-arabinofuranosidase-like protein n=1 Tax=Methylobacterium nodulans (strain LMG 21967 / CNCM I-2342 / ORS 2060) TaxID=460265 RepID=B8IJR0_METNO|nr:alpha-L-arabinofuranosidase [Methylobacterium nodulans]ACL58108.1 alpha-L-arabinofuranosidase-like protein [Methylobacterium nodulans ORS 2060]
MRRNRILAAGGALCAALLGLVLVAAQPAPGPHLANAGFEQAGSPPPGWTLDIQAADKGSVRQIRVAGAEGHALALSPNARNRGGDKPLGLGQVISATEFGGRPITLRARLGAEGGAAAVLGVAFLDQSGAAIGAPLILRAAAPPPLAVQSLRSGEPVPATAQQAIVFLVAEGQTGTAYFDEIVLVPEVTAAPSDTRSQPFAARVSLVPGEDLGPVRRDLFGTNVEWIRNAQGLWNTATGSLDADMLALAKAAGVSVLRFPGGGWSDSYDWRNGVGPQATRPRARHAPGEPEESPNVVGTDEIIEAARRIGADLLITLNLGSGTPELAAEWARYIRARVSADSRPHITWELGNELYMEEDISRAQTDPQTYVKRARATIAAVRAVDPAARFYAIGLENFGRYRFNAHPGWNDTVLTSLAGEIDGLAIHNGYAPLLPGPGGGNAASVYRAMLAAPANMAANLVTTMRQLQAAQTGRRLTLAVTEWGPLFAVDPANRYFDHVKTLGSGLYAARVLNVLLRTPGVTEAEFFKLSDLLNAGWIGRKVGGGYAATPALEVLRLYATNLAGRLIGTRVDGPTFSGGPIGFVDRVEAAPTVDAVASLTEAGDLAVLLSNASLDAPAEIDLALDQPRAGSVEILTGPSPDASRGTGMISVPGLSFAPTASFGAPRPHGRDEITLATQPVAPGARLHLVLPPVSVAALRLVPAR